jgi:diadenosine tetraphosphatase ApaH/serine/threonine PP2A family protein phosphatase
MARVANVIHVNCRHRPMKMAVLADLHANREATQAVLEHASACAVQRRVFLGDLVGYGADPAWVVDEVRRGVERGDIVVQGNHDHAVASAPSSSMKPSVQQLVAWTRTQLDPAQLAFLAALPLTAEHGELLFVHANAREPGGWAYVQSRIEAAQSMRATRRRITFCGHMHDPRLFHLSSQGNARDVLATPGQDVALLPPRRWLVIPGAVGQPRDGNPAACYATFDDEHQELCFWRVPYDHPRAAEKIIAAGLPAALAQRLIDGR